MASYYRNSPAESGFIIHHRARRDAWMLRRWMLRRMLRRIRLRSCEPGVARCRPQFSAPVDDLRVICSLQARIGYEYFAT